jgi:DNA-binding response OmpR family regulator
MNQIPQPPPHENIDTSAEERLTAPDESGSAAQDRRKRILVIEDDRPLADLLAFELESQQFSVETAEDGELGLASLKNERRHDLLILDLNLPKVDGVTVLREVKLIQPRLPILVLTALTRVEDKVKALHTGADDYITKPFSLLELRARVHALLRRSSEAIPNFSKVADLILYRDEHRVERNGRRIDVTPREFAVLEFLMRNAGRPVSREVLLQEVWNMPPDPSTNIVDVYMKYVRDKVDGPGEVKLTRTIRGVGYEIRDA